MKHTRSDNLDGNGVVSTVVERICAGGLVDYQIHANCSNRAGISAGKLAMVANVAQHEGAAGPS